ncbi:MAG TPA: xylulokinase [Blastocatellia bacterium]|jgi:xylulokinase|nr:xylulokinase [Blastocatellia bacterium]
MSLYLGIDISTTGAKALLIDGAGRVVASAATPLSLSTPRPLWAEQEPRDWWQAVRESINRALIQAGASGPRVSAVGLTGQMHGLVLLDEQGDALRPAILWNDQRCGEECDLIRERLGRDRLIQITGNDALPGFTAPKILWVQKHEPELYARARHVLLPKDYIRYRLTGDFRMDKADGSGTILFDLKKRDWSSDMLAALDIPGEWLPPTFEGPQVTGEITRDAWEATGLNPGTPVMAGGGDQAAGAVGMGAVRPGIVALTLGTSGVVFAPTESPLIEREGRLHSFCHAMPGRWHLMGVMLSAAGSLQWMRDSLAPGASFDELIDEAGQVPAGSEGLIFLPYLSGERTPYPDPLARGAWVGLTVRHRRGHLTRAVLEGVAFGLKDSFALIQGAGLESFEQARVSGGGAKSALWRQILADVLRVELVTVNTTEGAAFGAALLAGTGRGEWSDVDTACAETVKITGRVSPDTQHEEIYLRLYERYRSLYPALTPTFRGLASIES